MCWQLNWLIICFLIGLKDNLPQSLPLVQNKNNTNNYNYNYNKINNNLNNNKSQMPYILSPSSTSSSSIERSVEKPEVVNSKKNFLYKLE